MTRDVGAMPRKKDEICHYLSPETFPTDILTSYVRISIGIINSIYPVKVFKFQRDRNSHGGSLN